MNSRPFFALAVLAICLVARPASAAFTSFHVFGDSISCTASNTPSTLYYGKGYSNGRVWIEVLAEMMGLPFNPTNGNPHSYFANTSSNLFNQTSSYIPQSPASNALVVIWVNNADFFGPVSAAEANLVNWTNIIKASQTNHYRAITNLYFAKGIRTLIMPNLVDVSTVPYANASGLKGLFHDQCVKYNVEFTNTLQRARTNCPDLTILTPDYYALLADMLANPSAYGLTNINVGGQNVSALFADNYGYPSAQTNGYGTNHIFWDDTDPTAKVHFIMASNAFHILSPPPGINRIYFNGGGSQLVLTNLPVKQAAQIQVRTNLATGSWVTNQSFNCTNRVQTNSLPASAPASFYRLAIPPMNWTWP